MKLERKDVDFPLWRKKVDKSLFIEGTPLPNWAASMWSVPSDFSKVLSKKDPTAKVTIELRGNTFNGFLYSKKKAPGRSRVQFYLALDPGLRRELKHTFVMSYLRSIESSLAGKNSDQDSPFWEFLDIEYDSASREFHFVAHYIQEPYFPQLFKSLLDSYVIEKIEDQIKGKLDKPRIYKTDWKNKEDFDKELDSTNLLYTLLDTRNRELYVGETESLRSRFSAERPEIPDWDKFRLDVLPAELAPYRRDIERLMIRTMAGLIENEKGIPSMGISDYVLKNKKIDT